MKEKKSIWVRCMRKYFMLCAEKEKDFWAEEMAYRISKSLLAYQPR